MTVAVEVLPHYQAILARLRTIPTFDPAAPVAGAMAGYDGEVDPAPPLDSDKRVHAYWVLWVGAGSPLATKLCGDTTDLDLPFQVTVAAGDAQRVLWGVDRVRAVLLDHQPVVVGRSTLRIRGGIAAGAPRLDRNDTLHPPRFFTPLPFRLYSIPA